MLDLLTLNKRIDAAVRLEHVQITKKSGVFYASKTACSTCGKFRRYTDTHECTKCSPCRTCGTIGKTRGNRCKQCAVDSSKRQKQKEKTMRAVKTGAGK